MSTEKTRENRLRRQLDRRGFVLRKSQSLYAIVDPEHGGAVTPGLWPGMVYGLELDDVEAWVRDHDAQPVAA